jgi:staphyloferrin B biosynthesis citrate synthase
MNGAELRQALREGRRVYGTCVVSTSPQWPAMIAGTGLDFVFIDTEHIPIERDRLSWMCQTFRTLGLPPIVRIPKPDPYIACMALDGGASGVVAPYMESVDEVHELRGAVKYRPLKGQRLERVLDGTEALDETLSAYIANHNKHNLCIVNIESVPAIAALDDLLAVPDVDALLIGPHDLSINLGIPEQYADPRFTDAVKEIVDKGRSAGVGVGFHYSFGIEQSMAWAELGANLIVHSSDYFIVRDTLSADIRRFREAMGDAERGSEAGGPDTVTI